jgi:hypothetical protein
MFIAKKALPRRTFLRGLGTCMALPLLDAMVPAATALAQTPAAPRPRIGFIYFPHGAVMDQWTPTAAGRDFELPQILAPFAPFKDQMTVVSNLRNRAAEGYGVHTVNPGTWLSCMNPGRTREGGDPNSGLTADQVIARELGSETPFPSLEMCVELASSSGSCHADYGCGFRTTVSFRGLTQPVPMEHNPRKLFYRLFGEGDTAAERAAILVQTVSLLDLVSESAASLRVKLAPVDRVRLEQYMDSVRDIEAQVQKLAAQDSSAFELPDAPAGAPPAFEDHIKLMFDLLALAYQADLTRVASFMMAAELSMMTYNQIGISESFHPLSHHQNNPDKLVRLANLQTYHSKIFAGFLEKMANTPDGDGSLLDHSVLLYGSNMSDGNRHSANPLPNAVFGRAYGRIRGGQHLVEAPDTPLANLILTLVNRGGVPLEHLGLSTGEIANI